MSGKILLQVEESGEGWYVDPDTQKRAYLGRPADAFRIMRELGLGVAHEQLQKYLDSQFPSNLSGKILLDVEKNGEAYYVDPDTLEGYFLGKPKDAFQVMRERGKGISNENLDGIAVHEKYSHKNQGDQNGDHKYYEVSNVVDGDTIDVIIDGEEERIRMIGVDTPETKDPRTTVECFGKEASQKTKEELSGKEVRLEFDETQGKRGHYGRLLAYVLLKDGTNFNKSLIKQGYAHEYTYNIPYKYQEEFKQAEDYARENEKGLWAEGACEDYENGEEDSESSSDTSSDTSDSQTSSGLTITNIHYEGEEKPKEPDEYVVIENKGEGKVNLEGYTLSDESDKTYQFGDIVLETGDTVKVYTGCGEDNSQELYWCHTQSAIWNNTGDTGYLRSSAGDLLSEYGY
jgi:micrococcal nuclease